MERLASFELVVKNDSSLLPQNPNNFKNAVQNDDVAQVQGILDGNSFDNLVVEGGDFATRLSGKELAIDVTKSGSEAVSTGVEATVSNVQLEGYNALGAAMEGEGDSDLFGSRVSMSYDGLVVAVSSRNAGVAKLGRAYVYAYNTTTGQWEQRGDTFEGNMSSDQLFAVALNGDGTRLFYGERNPSSQSGSVGQVHAFDWDATTSQWNRVGGVIDGDSVTEQFSISLATNQSGDRLVVGAIDHNTGTNTQDIKRGRVVFYDYVPGSNTWLKVGEKTGSAEYQQLGRFVACSADGTRIVAGASGGNYARIWQRSDTGTNFTLINEFTGHGGEDFGRCVDMTADGNRVVVGADHGGANLTGYVSVFDYNTTTQQYALTTTIDMPGSDLPNRSCAVSKDGAYLVIGSFGANKSSNGRVRMYQELVPGEFTLRDVMAVNGTQFGHSVAMDETGLHLIATEPGQGVGGVVVGTATVYKRDADTATFTVTSGGQDFVQGDSLSITVKDTNDGVASLTSIVQEAGLSLTDPETIDIFLVTEVGDGLATSNESNLFAGTMTYDTSSVPNYTVSVTSPGFGFDAGDILIGDVGNRVGNRRWSATLETGSTQNTFSNVRIGATVGSLQTTTDAVYMWPRDGSAYPGDTSIFQLPLKEHNARAIEVVAFQMITIPTGVEMPAFVSVVNPFLKTPHSVEGCGGAGLPNVVAVLNMQANFEKSYGGLHHPLTLPRYSKINTLDLRFYNKDLTPFDLSALLPYTAGPAAFVATITLRITQW